MAGIQLSTPTGYVPSKGIPLPVTGPALGALQPQPLRPTPLQAPQLPASPQAPGFTFAPPTLGPAPTATPYGTFTAPNPSQVLSDPAAQFRIDQANKGANRSAAAHGTLLSGGFQQALAKLNQGLASEEYDKIFGRSLTAYNTNRDTNQQNFGQSLASYGAGTGATLDSARLGLQGAEAGYDRQYGSLRDAYHDARDNALAQNDTINANAAAEDAYGRQMEAYRASLARQQSLAGTLPQQTRRYR